MTLALDFQMLPQKLLIIAAQNKVYFWVLENLLLISLGQDQQQHPALLTGGVSRVGSVTVAVGVSDM